MYMTSWSAGLLHALANTSFPISGSWIYSPECHHRHAQGPKVTDPSTGEIF